MIVFDGMRNLCGIARWSVKYQLPMSTFIEFGLYSSMESTCGGSVCVSASLMRTRGTFDGGSSAPGEPPVNALARQFAPLSHALDGACSSITTSEKPKPSVVGYHVSW